jgi:hypothetical protein
MSSNRITAKVLKYKNLIQQLPVISRSALNLQFGAHEIGSTPS